MLGTHAIKQYFASGTTHYVTPLLSAEWNYNLFYAPYTTFAGDGTNKSTYTSWTWTNTPSTTTTESKYGGTALKFGGTDVNGHGSSKTTISINTNDTNTYKVVFYAKASEDVQVNLAALTYIDGHRSNSSSQVIDSTQWIKFETYVSTQPTEQPYSSFDLTLDYTSTDNTSTNYHILIDMVQIYQTTEFEYQYGNLWQTKAPFGYFRPGESYISSGNSLTPLPSNFRKITNKPTSVYNWDNQMPCSPVIYHPAILQSGAGNPIYKNGMLSDFSQYRYYVSTTDNTYLGAVYEQDLYSNKIVLKFNIAYSTPTVNIRLYGPAGYDSNNISVTPNSAGVAVLYRQIDGSWSTNTWSIMPKFDLTGSITNSQPINKIVINQTSSSLNSLYSVSDSVKTEMGRLQVIEISPRLELDLTDFTMNVDTVTQLDNKQNPLPISAISSNTATIELSSIPLSVSSAPLSLFSNNSNSSPLKGLFKKGVKFYINYIVRDQVSVNTPSDKVIAGGVYYADSWNTQDLQRTQVICFDISQQLQLRSPTDYVSQSESSLTVITDVMDFAGFTDYDYDSLKQVCMLSDHPIHSPYYYADGQQQKVFDVLRELFEVYQIGAFIDPYGVMQFLSLGDILSKKNNNPNMVIHDSTIAKTITDPSDNQILTVSPNIVEDTYTENVKVKLGKATLRYRTPNVNKTISADGQNGFSSPLATTIINKNDALWTLDTDEMTTFNYLNSSIDTVSQNYFNIAPDDLLNTFNSFNVDHDGYAIIEGEIVSFRDKEFHFTTKPYTDSSLNLISPVAPTNDYVAIVSNQADLKAWISDFSAQSGYGGTVSYVPTGKICNVQRGLFNTPVRTHKVIKTADDLATKVTTVGTSSTMPIPNGDAILLGANPSSTNPIKNIVKPIGDTNSSAINYNTFSVKMDIGPKSKRTHYDGLGGGIAFPDSNIYVEIRKEFTTAATYNPLTSSSIVNVSSIKYMLYVYQGNNESSTIMSVPGVDVTGLLNTDSARYYDDGPMEEYTRIINLKFVKTSSSTFEVYVNKHKVNITPKSGINLNLGSTYGMFSHAKKTASGSVAFTELYATQTALSDPDIYYHYELPSFANAIVGGHKVFEVNYMFQVRPQIVGITKFDIRYSTAPSMTAYPLKVAYNWYYFINPTSDAPIIKHVSIDENALNYSNIHHSGFQGRSLIINSSPSAIWLKKAPDTTNSVDVIFSINTDNLIVLSDEVVMEKVFDEANIAESIEIRSSWVQSKNAAIGILNTIFKAIDGFSRDTQISIYGNPLFEIGDIVHINYNLKNIGVNETVPNRYFVQGVQQTFDTGLKTVLTLNQIA